MAFHVRSVSSSEKDFLPGSETVPPTPLAKGMPGRLTLPPGAAARGASVGHSSLPAKNAHQRLSPRWSPRLAQSAAAAVAAAGLTPRGNTTHEDSGLWIPARESYQGLGGSTSSQRYQKVENGFSGLGPGPAPNLRTEQTSIESPREKHVPLTTLAAAKNSGSVGVTQPRLSKLQRPPRPSNRNLRSTWPGVEARETLTTRGAPRLRHEKPPSHGVGQDIPLPDVSPGDIVLEERAGLGTSVPDHSSAVKEDPGAKVSGLAATTRQKVLMLREQVGALAAYCDRLEHAAGLAEWHGGMLPLGPAHTTAMKAAAQQLSVWDTEVDTENTKVLPSPRTEMAQWLEDLTKTSKTSRTSSPQTMPGSVTGLEALWMPHGPDQGAGPMALAQPPVSRSICWDLGALWPQEDISRWSTPGSHAGWAQQTSAC